MKFSLWSAVRHTVLSVLSVLGGVTLGAMLVSAATTISTNITTAGTFNADDAATLGSTLAVTGSSTVQALNVGGEALLNSTLNVVGSSTVQALNIGGAGMLSSTTATALKVGQTGTRHTGILSGYCTIATPAGHTATTTQQFTCASATGVTTSYKVFVQATSSLPSMYVIQSATSSTNAIEVRIFNTGLGTTTAGGLEGPTSLNYWAVL